MTVENEMNKHRMDLARKCVSDAKEMMGEGWKHISPEVRWGLVCANIMAIVSGQDEEVSDKSVRRMLNFLEQACRGMIFS